MATVRTDYDNFLSAPWSIYTSVGGLYGDGFVSGTNLGNYQLCRLPRFQTSSPELSLVFWEHHEKDGYSSQSLWLYDKVPDLRNGLVIKHLDENCLCHVHTGRRFNQLYEPGHRGAMLTAHFTISEHFSMTEHPEWWGLIRSMGDMLAELTRGFPYAYREGSAEFKAA